MALQSTLEKDTFVDNEATFLSLLKKEHLIAGVAGGAVSCFAMHPLDLIKTRFAVNEGIQASSLPKRPQYTGVWNAVRTIYAEEGVVGLYRGVTPNILGASTAWGLYFLFYNAGKSWFQNGDPTRNLGPAMHMSIAAQSGALTLLLTNPIWVVKTRLCLQYAGDKQPYATGIADALRRIYAENGIRGWYKGLVPGIFGVSHGALQFMAYEELKTAYNSRLGRPVDFRLTSLEYLTFAVLSKLFAASATYPYQVVRWRLQDQHRDYAGLIDVLKQTWTLEGVRGFYKGLVPNLLRVAPATGLTFVVYEGIVSFLGKKGGA